MCNKNNMLITLFSFIALSADSQLAKAKCKDGYILKDNLDNLQKEDIIDRHNRHRNNVAGGLVRNQPPAQDMLEIKWDDELAALAQKWSNKCVLEMQPDGKRKLSDGTKNNQNLGYVMFTADGDEINFCKPGTPVSIVDMWYDEVVQYKYSNSYNKDTSQYTQLIWANTGRIGCGYTIFNNSDYINCYLVCNYNPAGNVMGEYPYQRGVKNCEGNDLLISENYTHLCAHKKQ